MRRTLTADSRTGRWTRAGPCATCGAHLPAIIWRPLPVAYADFDGALTQGTERYRPVVECGACGRALA